jgi:hypothetical protein
MWDKIPLDKTLSDFCNMEVVRSGNVACVIFDCSEGKEIRLIGFATEAWKSNFTIQEEAYGYYNALIETLNGQ